MPCEVSLATHCRGLTHFAWSNARVKALVKTTAGVGFVLKSVPEPTIRDDEVLIRVRRAGVCGTDVHIYDWDPWAQGRIKPPVVVGHEFAGEVVQVGSLVTDVREGDRVTAEGHIVDGRCLLCRTGNSHVCPYTKIIGVDRDGCFAEYIAMPATNVWHLDDNISFDVGGIHDPMGNAFHTALTADIPGATVLVTGCGPIGIFAVGICRAAGASRIIASDINDTRLGLAKQMGAHDIEHPSEWSSVAPTASAWTSCSRCRAFRRRSIRRSRSCASAAACRCSASRPSRWTSISRPRSSSRV
jgi:threonine 3-dehydrogenase